MSAKHKNSAEFWNGISDNYSKQPIADEASYQRKLDATRRLMHPQMRLLEFGCGTGGTAIKHALYVEHITAVDISPKMLDIARGRAKEAGVTNISFVQSDYHHFGAPQDSFDMILGMSILHLMDDLPGMLRKTYTLLKPGGYFISSTVCLKDFPFYIRGVIPIMKALGRAPYLNKFTQAHLLAAVDDAGFKITEQWRPKKQSATFIVAQKPE